MTKVWDRKLIIIRIKEVVKNNSGMNLQQLVMKLSTNDPWMSEAGAERIVTSLIGDGQLIKNDKGEVEVCR